MSNIVRSQDRESPSSRPDVLVTVGENVRRLRQAAGLSQAGLAEASDLSRRMIVGIESGEANISLANLDRLAAALGTSFSEIVRPPGSPDGSRIRSVLWQGKGPDSRAVLLGTAPASREAELWTWALSPGERYEAEADSAGWSEMLFVLEGSLDVETAGGTRRVEVGDFLIFSSAQPYAFINAGAQTLRFVRSVVS